MADILIVDDDEEILLTLEIALQQAGHVVRTASEGGTALRLYNEGQPDLVIMDLVMPGKEGIESIIEMRGQNSPVKIIAISGAAYNLKVAKMLGADYTLEKPFLHETILSLVDTALGDE
jgi:DNA-binding response OmpR family regulator